LKGGVERKDIAVQFGVVLRENREITPKPTSISSSIIRILGTLLFFERKRGKKKGCILLGLVEGIKRSWLNRSESNKNKKPNFPDDLK
jgi:hypothetical protein